MDKPWDIDITIYDDETELLEGLLRREPLACTCLLKRFAPRLYRVAVQLMGQSDEADDVLQEAFIQACDRIKSFEGRSSLGSWLHRIVVNTALMRLRQRHPQPFSATAMDDDSDELLADEPLPEDYALTDELRAVLEQALLTLPDSLRTVVVLRDIEGINTRQSAEALGISEGALKVRLHRAHGALREILAGYVHDHHSEPDPAFALPAAIEDRLLESLCGSQVMNPASTDTIPSA